MAKRETQSLSVTDIVHDLHTNLHRHGLTKPVLDETVRATFDAILKRVSRGEPVNVRNFGTFEAKMFKGRELNTPLMKEQIIFPDQLVLRFKQSVTAKQQINSMSKDYKVSQAEIAAAAEKQGKKVGNVKAASLAADVIEDQEDMEEIVATVVNKPKKGAAAATASKSPAERRAAASKGVVETSPLGDDNVEEEKFEVGRVAAKNVGKKGKKSEAAALEEIKPKKDKKDPKGEAVRSKATRVVPVELPPEEEQPEDEEEEETEEDEEAEEDEELEETEELDEEPAPAPKKKSSKSK